jgi:hypothetical protein
VNFIQKNFMPMRFGPIGRVGMRKKREREDYYFGPMHVIVRGHLQGPQYGFITWSIDRRHTLDVWFGQTLLTFRRKSV